MKHLTWRAINFVKNNGAANAIAPYAAICCKAQQLVAKQWVHLFCRYSKSLCRAYSEKKRNL